MRQSYLCSWRANGPAANTLRAGCAFARRARRRSEVLNSYLQAGVRRNLRTRTRRFRLRGKALRSRFGFGRWRRASFVRENNPATRVRRSPHVGSWRTPQCRVTARARLEVSVGHLLHVLARLAKCGHAPASIHGTFARIVSRERLVQIAVISIEQ